MMTYVLSILIFLIAVGAMAIGWMVKKKAIRGSCGGLANVGVEKACDCKTSCNERQLHQLREPGSRDQHTS